jgi:uncharacterized membrane protein
MQAKAKIMGHPIHPMLIPFPVAFYTATVVAYILYALTASLFWFHFAVVMNIAGVVMAVVAAIPGIVDWTALPRKTPARSTGFKHLLLNAAAGVVFAVNAGIQLVQWNELRPSFGAAIVLSLTGLVLTGIAGVLGWTMVQHHHVGVELTPEQERLEPEVRHRPT